MLSDDALDSFQAEPGGARAASVSLEDLAAAGSIIHWGEGVAVIEELCDLLLSSSGTESPVPGLGDVRLDAAGTLTVTRTRGGERGSSGAGRALQALLGNSDVPVALRLLITQSTAPETRRTLREFVKDLAYFGRAGRPALLQALYARHVAAAPGSATPPVPERPPDLERPAQPAPGRAKGRRRRWVALAASVGGLIVVAAAAWFWSEKIGEGSTALVTRATQTLAELRAPAPEPPAEEGTAAPASQPPRAATRPRAAPAPAAAAPVPRDAETSAPRLAPLASRVVSTAADVPWPLAPSAPASVGARPASSVAPVGAEERDPAYVFSSQDAEVEPPVLLYPQLPPPMILRDQGTALVNRMELVVSPEGTVERVRLIDGPTRMPDMMLLSGAKTWRFTPAYRNGEPVRYRTTLVWSGFP